MTVPLVLLLVLVFGLLMSTGGGSGSSGTSTAPGALPALTPSAPPSQAAAVAPCTRLLQNLPVRPAGLAPRAVHPHPDSEFVVGWGDPAVILRCGVARPADLHPGSTAQFLQIGQASGTGGVYFDVTSSGGDQIYTSVDRVVYVEITVPPKYSGSPLPSLADAIAKSMPPVCVGAQSGSTPTDKLCTHRK